MREIQIELNDADQRIDRYLRKYLPGASLGYIYKLARTGKVKLNGKRVDNETRIQKDDVLKIFLHDEEIAWFQKEALPLEIPKSSNFSEWILFEDDDLLVVQKPPNMNVHPWDHKTKEISLIQLASDYFGGKYTSQTFSPSLVHRLDRDTSGALLIAKNRPSLNVLLEQLQSHSIEKTYLCIVVWKPEKARDTIRLPLLRVENAHRESKVKVDKNGQRAVTHYQTCAQGEKLSLMRVQLETGRMHQIRVHLASLWCPILGDSAYGIAQKNLEFLGRGGRQMLHAAELSFIHPKTGQAMRVKASIPPDMQKCIQSYFPELWALEAW